ncbi:MAG: ribokinase [Oscillospiraceae bacterium]
MAVQSPDVVVFHSHGVGQYVRVSKFPVPGETIRALSWDNDRDGGKGSNVAIALAKLGVSSAFFGKVGNDIFGDLGEKWMSELDVDVSMMLRDDKLQTSTGVVVIDDNGDNLIITKSTGTKFSHEEIDTALQKFSSSKVFITGFEIDISASLYGARLAHKLGMTTLLNPSPLPDFPLGCLDFIDVLIVNEIEGLKLSDLPDTSDCISSSQKIVANLADKYSVPCVIMTMGKHGSITYDSGEIWQTDPVNTKVVDTAGAGDGFLSAIAACKVWGVNMKTACEWANVFSSIAVSRLGTFPSYPTLEEMNAVMRLHE